MGKTRKNIAKTNLEDPAKFHISLFQVSGTVRGLSTLVRLPNGQIQSMLWGLPDKSRQKETLMVGYALRHYSAVDVSVVGVRVTEVRERKVCNRLRDPHVLPLWKVCAT